MTALLKFSCVENQGRERSRTSPNRITAPAPQHGLKLFVQQITDPNPDPALFSNPDVEAWILSYRIRHMSYTSFWCEKKYI
jgi:hypothetical protein